MTISIESARRNGAKVASECGADMGMQVRHAMLGDTKNCTIMDYYHEQDTLIDKRTHAMDKHK